jgi:hypothetical protein
MGVMNAMRIVIPVLIVLTLCCTGSAESKGSHLSEQMEFSAEDNGVKRPAPIPELVLLILRKDEGVRIALENENIPAEKMPQSWFSASKIHLNGSEQVDLVVMGEGPLRGSNVITFWVFCGTSHGYELVLTAAAHNLLVTNKRWKAHREIELVSATSARISSVGFRFNGKRYAEYETRSEPIR